MPPEDKTQYSEIKAGDKVVYWQAVPFLFISPLVLTVKHVVTDPITHYTYLLFPNNEWAPYTDYINLDQAISLLNQQQMDLDHQIKKFHNETATHRP